MEKILPIETKLVGIDEYQTLAGKYQTKTSPPEERVFGLLAEAGEVAGVFQKMLRGKYDDKEATKLLYYELGDVLWYLARVAADNDWKLSDLAQDNINKLEARAISNTIVTR